MGLFHSCGRDPTVYSGNTWALMDLPALALNRSGGVQQGFLGLMLENATFGSRSFRCPLKG